jgi:hypothetical protein
MFCVLLTADGGVVQNQNGTYYRVAEVVHTHILIPAFLRRPES